MILTLVTCIALMNVTFKCYWDAKEETNFNITLVKNLFKKKRLLSRKLLATKNWRSSLASVAKIKEIELEIRKYYDQKINKK